jgi:hypothetical protein
VHLWFDREITELDHAVLLDREIHWMYNKSRLQPWRKTKGSYLELVVSASQEFAALSREEAIDLAVRELAEFFPEVAGEARKSCAREGSPRNIHGAAGNRCGKTYFRVAVAELRDGRRLDCHGLALDDGERGAQRSSGRSGCVRRDR